MAPDPPSYIGPPTLEDIPKKDRVGGGGDENAPPGLDLSDPIIAALLGGIVGGGGSSSSGSSGGSSGGGAPGDPQVSEATAFYLELWGKLPPNGYVQNFIGGQTDIFDFIRFQLSRPGARKTRFYADRLAGYAAQAASIMGRR
jgi:hypothetical protein